ncbi:MAG: ABC transporter ATP-binding protein [Planctomycetota bacterium]|nr:MAG: ABC transporter ATP-binding protein [Planctomycetota bacterium]
MAVDAAIEVENLRKTYRDGLFGKRRIEALRGVSLAIPRGEIFGLLGPNGAGKTTLIKVVLGLVNITAGGARMLGRQVGDRRARRRVGYLPEGHRFPQHHTGNSALVYFGGLSGVSPAEVRRRTPALLEQVGLAEWGQTSVRKYSKGMQQRLGLAQAMLHDPELLILDEPTDGVDPVGRKEMRVLLQNLKARGKTIFINSHLLQEVELVCDRVAILTHGEVRRIGNMDELTRGPQAEFTFTLAADEAAARRALANHDMTSVTPLASGQIAAQMNVTLAVADQAAVDRAVDDVRRAGISIVAMTGRRRTLEDTFLEVVQAEGQPLRAVPLPAARGAGEPIDAEIL